MRDILCNGPSFEIILKFCIENTLNSRKKGKYYHRRQMFITKLRNWTIPFKLARLLITHDGGKLTRVGELSLSEGIQGRKGNPSTLVGLP